MRAGVGHSTAADAKTAASEAAQAAMAQAGLREASGALCFATTALGAAYPLILRTVASMTRTREVAGCSAAGVIASRHEIESGAAISVLVFGGDGIGGTRLFAPSLRGRSGEVAAELAAAARPALERNNLLCLFADTYNLDPGPLLASLARELPGVKIAGGGATEDGSIGETFQFCGDAISSNAVSGMLIHGDFALEIGSSLACAPVGPAHRVSRVRDNIILELDGRPAFEAFAAAAGPLAGDLQRAAAFIFLAVPFDPGAERIKRGGYYLRNIIGASAQGPIAVAHRPCAGDLIGFAVRSPDHARDDLKLELEALRKRLVEPPVFGLYFDCVSRGLGLYNIPGHDAAYIGQYLGDFPVGGFFTGFELGPAGETTSLLQYSGVLALVSKAA
jgi:small ligand-binding sensory domain FIST